MTVLTAYVEDVKRTLDEIKPYFLGTKSCAFYIDPEDFKNKKWNLLEKKFHLLQIEVEKQQIVEELAILSKEHPRKVSPKKTPSILKFGVSNGFGPSPPSGWGRQSSPDKDNSPPPPPTEKEEPKKS